MEWQNNSFTVSDDQDKLDIEAIYLFLTNSYWAKGRSKDLVEKSIRNSFTLGLYLNNEQVGFARAVTDYSTFAYLCDVYVKDEYQKEGLGHFLMDCLFKHPKTDSVTWILKTTYSQSLYRDFHFQEFKSPTGWMSRFPQQFQN